MSVVALIPARAGSKGILGKNKKKFRGKPLFLHTLESAVHSEIFDTIIVSTDDEWISGETLAFRNALDRRPPNIIVHQRAYKAASDVATAFDVIDDVADGLDDEITICYLQPTSPLRSSFHIKEAYSFFDQHYVKGLLVFSGRRVDSSILKAWVGGDDLYFKPIAAEFSFANRQALPKVMIANGAIYLFKLQDVLEVKSLSLPLSKIYEMTEKDSLDLDSSADWQEGESIVF